MSQFLQNVFNGLVSSGIYLLVALGITMVFGLTRFINFAHGQLVVIGAFVCYDFTSRGVSFWWGLLAATGVTALLALVMERAIFRFTLKNPLNGLVCGLGVFYVLQYVINRRWGLTPLLVTPAFSGNWVVGGVVMSLNGVVAIGIAIVLTVSLLVLIRRSTLGRQMRAVQQDPLAASHSGIKTGAIISIVFVVGSAVAGASGAALGTLYPIDPAQGGDLILAGFAVALLGGLGNVYGAVTASLIYGIGQAMISGYGNATWVDYYTYGIIILIILLRPSGLFGAAASGDAPQYSDDRGLDLPRPPLLSPRSLLMLLWIVVPVIGFEALSSGKLQTLFTLCAVYAVMAYSLSLLYENVGMLSVASGGFMLIGAYTGGLLAEHLGWNFWAALPFAAILSGVAGALVGIPVARAKGHYFLLVTFAVGSLIVVMGNNLATITNGDEGLILTQNPGSIGPFSFMDINQFYFLCLTFVVLSAITVAMIRRSRLGSRFAAIRDNENLARSLGLRIGLYKILAFGFSSAIAGVGGLLFLYQQKIVSPDDFAVLTVITFMIMVIVGGRSILGPAVGAGILIILPGLVNLSPTSQELAFGVILIVVVLVMPRGIVPGIRDGLRFMSTRARTREQRSVIFTWRPLWWSVRSQTLAGEDDALQVEDASGRRS